MNLLIFLAEMVKETPLYVWVILVLLVIRGRMASRDGALCFPKTLIFPVVFLTWELETVVHSFSFPWESIASYVVLTAVGTPLGYRLYCRFRSYYQKDGAIWRSGTYVALVIMMTNFLVKYIANVALAIRPAFYGSLDFNLFYSMAGGFSLGLSIGGIVQAYKAVREYGQGKAGGRQVV